MKEVWKDIKGYEGRYQVSNLGRVKSLPNSRRNTELILKQTVRKDRRYAVNLTKKRYGRWHQSVKQVHWLVARAFIGRKPAGKQVCHNDGNCQNNFWRNLRYDTPLGNIQDRVKHDQCNRGDKNGMASLTEEKVRDIKRRIAAGETQESIAGIHEVGRSAIGLIAQGRRWRHVTI